MEAAPALQGRGHRSLLPGGSSRRRTSRKWLSRRLRTGPERDSSGENARGDRLLVSGPALQPLATGICFLLVLDRGAHAEVTRKGENVFRVSPGRFGTAMAEEGAPRTRLRWESRLGMLPSFWRSPRHPSLTRISSALGPATLPRMFLP